MDEFEIIRRYFSSAVTESHAGILLGPGDDCALLQVPADSELCVSTDTLIESVHFPKKAAGRLVATRTLAANLSDLAAMGARPYGFTLALTLSEVLEPWLEEFSQCLQELTKQYQFPLIGGNLSKGSLSLTVTVMGIVPKGRAILRSTARVGDDIFVSGYLGDAAGGLKCLEKGATSTDHSQSGREVDIQKSHLNRYLSPVPRVELGLALRDVASAAIDISDGFSADLKHLCESSRVGARIQSSDIPLSPALKADFSPTQAMMLALSGGDDYELCFTVPKRLSEEVALISSKLNLPITCVGEITKETNVVIADQQNKPIDVGGYRHF